MHPVDVVVPAHDEADLLPACLHALLSTTGIDLRVVVVANGCSDSTADLARSFVPLATRAGHDLLVLDIPESGKALAMNAAEGHRRGCAVVYLDADTVLLPGALAGLAAHLTATEAPRLASPTPVLVRPRSWHARSFAAVWRQLPGVADDVVGAGCYAVNAAGRARWSTFPDLQADDLFVRGLFTGPERTVLPGGFLLVIPEGRELVRVIARWRQGNREVAARQPDGWTRATGGRDAHLAPTWLHPRLLPSVPAFLAMTAASRSLLLSGAGDGNRGWARARVLRAEAARPEGATATRAVTVDAVVVTHNSRDHVERCLTSLTSSAADIRVTVVDNASSDGTVDLVRRLPGVRLVARPTNVGFARAVNDALAGAEATYVLLVNPDVVLDPASVDELIAVALRFPRAGLYGGRARRPDGGLDPTSCLAWPSVGQALAFALGVSRWPGLSRLDPDGLRGWRRDDIRPVPVLTGSLLLVDGGLWRQLTGFDERYWLYGEDVDLCCRARQRGAEPLFTDRAGYVHVGGASSSAAERTALILRGKSTLYLHHLGPVGGRVARAALLAGVAWRAGTESLAAHLGRSRREPRWSVAWRTRGSWQQGWPPVRGGPPASTGRPGARNRPPTA